LPRSRIQPAARSRQPARICARRGSLPVWIVFLWTLAGSLSSGPGWVDGPGTAQAASRPRSTIGRPLGAGPIFLVGTLSVGGTKKYDLFRQGCGASFIFRPLAAADFLGMLYDWNAAMVLQAEYRSVARDRRLLSGDFLLRFYVDDMRLHAQGASPFVGLGIGGTEITFPNESGASGSETWFSMLMEAGYEASPSAGWVITAKAQWRRYRHNDHDYSGWSAQLGVGIPVPW
jgi:hypothetical protein